MKVVSQSVDLLWCTPDSEKQIELAGRTCYKSESKITKDSARSFCRRMRESGHHAMLEHACASFRIICDRGISHEIVRHRLASYAQESTRYCNYGTDKFDNEITVVQPLKLDVFSEMRWLDSCNEAEYAYLELLKSNTPQIARAILPTCLKTELVMTANFREWRHFISLRHSAAAHPQIRPVAYEVWKSLMGYAPSVFEDLIEETLAVPVGASDGKR
jgi:thymidylate synthase (FAD)